MTQITSMLVVLLSLVWSVNALDNGLVLTPPMGFLSWGQFRCNVDCENDPDNCISENLYTNMADQMIADGYYDAGYRYVIMDDCWLASERDADGKLAPDTSRFPNGIKYLADYMHTRGLLFGIYEDVGTKTCAGYPGSNGHYDIDAQTFADWGVDYLKFDGCNENIDDMPDDYISMSNALIATGRPIVFSCEWAVYMDQPDYKAIANTCNLCRNYDDIQNNYGSLKNIYEYMASNQDDFGPVAGPGYWNDPDMLIIGETEGGGSITFDQSQVQMALWSILASPLLISADLRTIDADLRDILLNEDAIAINQDSLGIQGTRILVSDDNEIWTRPITPNNGRSYSYGVAFLNNAATVQEFTISLELLGLNDVNGYQVKDVFTGNDLGLLLPTDVITVSVNSTGIVFLKATLNI